MTDEISLWRTAAYKHARERDEARTTLAAIREYLETSDDEGIRTREHLLGILDQVGVPSMVAAELAACPTACDADCGESCHEAHQPRWKRDHEPDDCPESLPELIREDAVEAMRDMATGLYRAEDRLAFVREMCDAAERNGQQVTTEQVRAWTQYEGCGGAIVLPEDEQQRLKAAMALHSLTGRIIDRAQAERWKAAGRCGTCGFDGDRTGCQDCGVSGSR